MYKALFELEPARLFEGQQISVPVLAKGPDITVSLSGRDLTVQCDAKDKAAALRTATDIVERLCRVLSLQTLEFITYTFGGLDRVNGVHGDSILPGLLHQWRIGYNPDKLARDLAAVSPSLLVSHPRFEKACDYFTRGLFYSQEIYHLVDPQISRGSFYAAEAALNFYKAIVLLLGDPIRQPAFAALKYDRTMRLRIIHAYDLRNNEDVAHPSLDWNDIENRMGVAKLLAKEILEGYRLALQVGTSIPEPPRAR